MSARAAFLAGLRRRPYDRVGFNCWHAAGLIQATLFGRALPLVEIADLGLRARIAAFATHAERAAWREISAPVDGAFVLMGRAPGREHHCGVWLAEGGGRVWHGDAPHGVVDDTPLELAQSRRWRLTNGAAVPITVGAYDVGVPVATQASITNPQTWGDTSGVDGNGINHASSLGIHSMEYQVLEQVDFRLAA